MTTQQHAPHLIIEARAGTGKTTTLVEGLKQIKGLDSPFTPSPQQAAVWTKMAESSDEANTICFVAFNKSIANELKDRVPAGCEAMTMHSMGFKAVRSAFGRVKVDNFRVSNIIADILGKDIRELRRDKGTLETVKAVEKLVSLCKMNLVLDPTDADLLKLAAHYDIDLNGNTDNVLDAVPEVLERCLDVGRDKCINFDDMIWIPIALNLGITKYDLLLVDEAQDLNRCQQALALKAGDRLILCGDPKQAIYGFAGADSESMPRMTDTLDQTQRGVVTLPLTVTRRCGVSIVEEAKTIVPDFEAHETCTDGTVGTLKHKNESGDTVYHENVEAGDMILCRVNAPLVSECFKFLKDGVRAEIQGRDVGKGLVATVKKMKASDVHDLIEKLDIWLNKELAKENARTNPSETRLMSLQDRVDCLFCFASNADSVDDVINNIEKVFTDGGNNAGCVRLSSIHKAKGLEADRVFLLQLDGSSVPHPMAKSAWQKEQEMNLKYVAITRAINEFYYVS